MGNFWTHARLKSHCSTGLILWCHTLFVFSEIFYYKDEFMISTEPPFDFKYNRVQF